MNGNNRPKYNVFVSYHADDLPTVQTIMDGLAGQDLDIKPFFDQQDLNGGQVWTTEISNALEMVGCVLVFCGKHEGPWQEKEILRADELIRSETIASRTLVPILLSKADRIPARLNFLLAGRTFIDFSEPTNPMARRKLLSAVHEAIELRRQPDRHRSSDSRYEIEIDVPLDEAPTCVVAAPSQVIQKRHALVQDAVERVRNKHKDAIRFLPADTKVVKLPPVGTDACIELIRGSELLVLDCIPFAESPETGKGPDITPRAAYCLGMANALGKPAILIARSKESVAAVVADGRQASCPQVDIVLEDELDQKMADCIWDACKQVTDLLVQDGVKGIHLLPADVKVRAELSGMFYRILSCGVEVLHCCQPLVREVHSLARHTQEVVEQANEDHGPIDKKVLAKRREDTRRKYGEFVVAHAQWEKAWAQLSGRAAEMKRDFERIQERLGSLPGGHGWFGQEAWQKALESVDSYVRSARELDDYATGKRPEMKVEDQVDFGCMNRWITAVELNGRVATTMSQLTNIWDQARKMLLEAIEVSLRLEGPKHDH